MNSKYSLDFLGKYTPKKKKKFTGKTDSEAEAPIVWPLDVKSQLIGKYPDAGKD